MEQHRGLRIIIIIIILLIIIPGIYHAIDCSKTLPPPPANWVSPPFTPGQTWEQYAQDFLSKNPAPNALSHYLIAFSLVTIDIPGYPGDQVYQILKEGWTQNYPNAEEILRLNQPALQEAILGTQMNHCELPPFPYSFKSPVPKFLSIQYLGKIFALNGKKLESQKKYHDALQHYLWGLRMGRDISQKDQSKISHLIGIAIIQINNRPLLNFIAQDKLSEPDYRQIIQELPTVEQVQGKIQDIMGMQYRLYYFELPKELSHPWQNAKGLGFSQRITVGNYSTYQNPDIMDTVHDLETAGYIFFNEGKIVKETVGFYGELLSIATTTTYQGFRQIDWNSKAPKNYLNTYLSGDNYVSSYTRQMVEFSLLRMAQIQAAIHLYHLKTKQWPKGLNDLEPDYIKKTLLDPFVDQPFQWSQDSGIPFVYSVGPDFRDDNVLLLYDPTNGTVSSGDIRP